MRSSEPRSSPDTTRKSRRACAASGFTILELMVVIAIILVLIGMAAGMYQQSVIRSKEAALKQNLTVMRQAIEQYTLDKQTAPQSLDDLVSAGYLREIPTDPMTRQKDWRVVYEDVVLSPDQTGTGITDVFSSSPTYSSW